MDRAAQVASTMNLGVFKEPRGLLRVIEWIIAIFAFATTTSHSSHSVFTMCTEQSKSVSLPFAYPYRLNQVTVDAPKCNSTSETMEITMFGNFASSAEFYVFVGVMAFLYTIAALVLYIIFDEKYRKFENIPIADFIVTALFTLLWLISSSAWAQGVSNIKYYTNPAELFRSDRVPGCPDTDDCNVVTTGNFASLNVSIIFGFLNMGVWGANLWFLFKETKWFKPGDQEEASTRETLSQDQPAY